MTSSTPNETTSPTKDRAVLFWRPDSDESHIQANVEQAAAFLEVPASAVVEAIDNGELLAGWFVDWQAASAA